MLFKRVLQGVDLSYLSSKYHSICTNTMILPPIFLPFMTLVIEQGRNNNVVKFYAKILKFR